MKNVSPAELWLDIESNSKTPATPDPQAVISTGLSESEPLALGIDPSRSQPPPDPDPFGSNDLDDAAPANPPIPKESSAAVLPLASAGPGQVAVQATASLAAVPLPNKKIDTATVAPDAVKPMGNGTGLQSEPAKAGARKSATVGKSKKAGTEDNAPSGSPFKEHEPWDELVDLALVLTEISALIRRYIILEPEQADAAALWVAHTHMIESAGHSPILIVNAPERACGKTLVRDVLGRLAYRALPASNASLSALFRSIEWGVTLLIDEADTFFRDSPELHGMVNAGHKRGGTVLRTEAKGDSFEPKAFPVYSAKSIAGIALERHLPDSTMSRGIVIGMRRKRPDEKVERLRYADNGVFDRLGSQLARCALDYKGQIESCRPELPDQLSDRAQDNWEPLLAIATAAGEQWLQRATNAALKLPGVSEAQASAGNDLLADIREVLADRSRDGGIPTAELIQLLLDDAEMGWNTYNRGKPLTPRQLAKMLDAYQIHPKTVRQPKSKSSPSGSTPKGYAVADFEDAFARYLKVPVEVDVVELPPSSARLGPSIQVAATAQQRRTGGVGGERGAVDDDLY